MKILVLGDIHGYTSTLDIPTIDIAVDIVHRTEADAVLQVGDMGGFRHFAKPVHWIFGNNDLLSVMKPDATDAPRAENLHNIKTGDVLTLASGNERIRVSGMNGAYDPLYFEFDRDRLDDLGYFTQSDVKKCLDLRRIDIFLAHGCPSGLGFGREPDHGVPAIRSILDAVRPRYMFCGHGHFFKKVSHNGCRIFSLGLVSREHYVLDTRTDELSVIKLDASRLPLIKQMIRCPPER